MNRPALNLKWRPLAAPGERSPPWLLALRDESGVYLMRDKSSGKVVYVGSSSTGRLKKTMLRHVQAWADDRSWWQQLGMFFGGSARHFTVDRSTVEVAVIVTPPGRARRLEAELIGRYKPAGNNEGADGVPF